MALSPRCWTHKTENKTWRSKMKIKTSQNRKQSLPMLHWPTVAYLTNVCLLVIMASTAIFSWYWLVMIAIVGCRLSLSPVLTNESPSFRPLTNHSPDAHLGICLTTVTVSSTPPTPATLVKLLRLCSSALIFLSSCSSEIMWRIWASELPVKLLKMQCLVATLRLFVWHYWLQ